MAIKIYTLYGRLASCPEASGLTLRHCRLGRFLSLNAARAWRLREGRSAEIDWTISEQTVDVLPGEAVRLPSAAIFWSSVQLDPPMDLVIRLDVVDVERVPGCDDVLGYVEQSGHRWRVRYEAVNDAWEAADAPQRISPTHATKTKGKPRDAA